MGFASGFRTGLATGEQRRSMMPIVQGLGSMIDRIERRNKKGSIRFGGSSGPSSYDKYVARKDKEEVAAEEKRRYESEQDQLRQREQQATDLAATQAEQAEVVEQRTAETHESKMATQAQQREKAATMFARSEKKESRIEAYRGFIQGIQSRNKALTEASWAALAPDMPEKEAAEWAPIKEEPYLDPETGQPVVDPTTGQPIRKFTTGRDEKGQESDKAMPAPAVTYNDDGSIAVEFPGQPEPVVYADAREFSEQIGYAMNPEFEKKRSDEETKERRYQKKEKRLDRKERLAHVQTKIKRLEKQRANDEIEDMDKYKTDMAALVKKEDKLMGSARAKEYKTVKVTTPEGEEMLAYADKQKPKGKYPANLQQDENGAWYYTDPETKAKNYFYPPSN
jgi:hypothetical protein